MVFEGMQRVVAIVALAAVGGCGRQVARFVEDTGVVDRTTPRDVPGETEEMDAEEEDVRADVRGDRADRAEVEDQVDPGDLGREATARDVPIESTVVGCMANSDCPSMSLFCNGPAGNCAARGFCTPRPDPMSCGGMDGGAEEQVCGCNGMTYPSLCALQAAGVRMQQFGSCPRD